MKPISLDLYKYLYRFTKAKNFSYYFSMAFVSVLHAIVVTGLLSLFTTVFSQEVIKKMNALPVVGALAVIFFIINYKRVPYDILSKERQIEPTYSKLIMYILLAIFVIAYHRFIK